MADRRAALLIVDVQYDFLPPSGSLAVPSGDSILPVVYRLLEDDRWSLVVTSQADHHPTRHVSFASRHGLRPLEKKVVPAPWKRDGSGIELTLWPDHCVRGTRGAEIEEGVVSRLETWRSKDQYFSVLKGKDTEVDAYSAFAPETAPSPSEDAPSPLTSHLRSKGITTVVTLGLATEYCVRATAVDGLGEGFEVWWVKDGMKAVGGPEAEQRTERELVGLGARVMTGEEVLAALGGTS